MLAVDSWDDYLHRITVIYLKMKSQNSIAQQILIQCILYPPFYTGN
jgi:hypothetical protein